MVLFHRWKTATWNMILAAELPGLWPQRQEGLEDRKMVCFCDPILSSEKRENSDRILTKDISLVGYDTNKIKILKCVFFLLSKVKKNHTFGHGVIEINCICKCWNITYCNITSLNCLYMIGSGSKIAPPVLEVYLSLGPSDWKGTFSILFIHHVWCLGQIWRLVETYKDKKKKQISLVRKEYTAHGTRDNTLTDWLVNCLVLVPTQAPTSSLYCSYAATFVLRWPKKEKKKITEFGGDSGCTGMSNTV